MRSIAGVATIAGGMGVANRCSRAGVAAVGAATALAVGASVARAQDPTVGCAVAELRAVAALSGDPLPALDPETARMYVEIGLGLAAAPPPAPGARLVSLSSGCRTPQNASGAFVGAFYPSITSDGAEIAWDSSGVNFGARRRANGGVWVHTAATGTTEEASVLADGTEPPGAFAYFPTISGNGRFVAFASYDSVWDPPGPAEATQQVYLKDRQTGTIERISRSTGGAAGDGFSDVIFGRIVSDDGNRVVLYSDATNLVDDDTNGTTDLFVRDRAAGTTVRATRNFDGGEPQNPDDCGYPRQFQQLESSISGDGRYVVFDSPYRTLVPGDADCLVDLFLRDLEAGTTERVALTDLGEPANNGSGRADISRDGRFVAFDSIACNLHPRACAKIVTPQLYVRDRVAGTTELVSVAVDGDGGFGQSWYPTISDDGRFVLFNSGAPDLVPGDSDTNGEDDLFVRDRQTGEILRLTTSTIDDGGDPIFVDADVSGDGSRIVFATRVRLDPRHAPGVTHVYLLDNPFLPGDPG